jgi:hypothetical protein
MSNREPGTLSGEHGMMFSPERIATLLQTTGGLLVGPSVLLMIWGHQLTNDYGTTMPRSPDAATGKVVPFLFRSTVVYITQAQNVKLDSVNTWWWATGLAAAVSLGMSAWMRARRRRSQGMPE